MLPLYQFARLIEYISRTARRNRHPVKLPELSLTASAGVGIIAVEIKKQIKVYPVGHTTIIPLSQIVFLSFSCAPLSSKELSSLFIICSFSKVFFN